jgi:hypothetical protein
MTRGRNIYVTEIPVLIACKFGEREGMLSFRKDQPVRILRLEELDDETEKGRKLWKSLSTDARERILGLIQLRQAVEGGNKDQAQKAQQRIVEAYRRELNDEELVRLTVKYVSRLVPRLEYELSKFMTELLAGVHLVLWWTGTRFVPALFCLELEEALAVRALLGIVAGRALLICPRCSKPFIQGRSDQAYCSMRCREAYRVARWRATRLKRKKLGRKRR